MSDDGSDHGLAERADREIFSSHGRLDVVEARDGGLSLNGGDGCALTTPRT